MLSVDVPIHVGWIFHVRISVIEVDEHFAESDYFLFRLTDDKARTVNLEKQTSFLKTFCIVVYTNETFFQKYLILIATFMSRQETVNW